MAIDAQQLTAMIDAELAQVSDSRVVAHAQALRVEPTVEMRPWDYGDEGQMYPCWTVLRHPTSNTGIAYCEHGFGPRSPWGLVYLGDDERRASMGMDSGWFGTFLETLLDSKAFTDLPIWRVFKTDGTTGERQAISDEGEWDATWEKVMALRASDPTSRYDCFAELQSQFF